jgi:hypothetical protein
MYTSYPAENVQPFAEAAEALLVGKPAPFQDLLHAIETVLAKRPQLPRSV